MVGLNNLYPPILETYMPAFVRTQTCKVYFSLSIYNSYEDIKNVQVIVSNQNTNMSVLKTSLYPTGIKITNINIDNSIVGDNKYYINISPSDLENNIFELNQFYKVQLRFTSVNASDITDNKKIATWLDDNQNFFSEWSTVCLIKGIQQPIIYIKNFDIDDYGDNSILTMESLSLVGKMYFSENQNIEKETLKSYNVKLYLDSDLENPVFNSGIIYTNPYNPNEINYDLEYILEDGLAYTLIFEYTTSNLYIEKKTYNFSVIRHGIDKLDAAISAVEDIENGRIKINIKSNNSNYFLGNLIIRRTSSETNFTIWEDVHIVALLQDNYILDYTWYDATVQSGVWYRYCAQRCNSKGDRGVIIQIEDPIMMVFDDSFLVGNGIQLKLKFNPQINSFKHTVLESKVDTLGSQYPFIYRNGNVNYRQFSLSGLISNLCDEDELFTSKTKVYEESKKLYDDYNLENNINNYQDYIYEREFREKVINFLNDGNVKLFKSTTEGNILVRLMDISFTPNQTLGRMLYTFSATAYEVDEANIDNYDKYDILTVGEYSNYIHLIFERMGQIKGSYGSEYANLLNIIQNKYVLPASQNFKNTLEYLDWLRIEFESEPYLIMDDRSCGVRPILKNESDLIDKNTIIGYIVYINGEPIVVSPRGYYELKDDNTRITSIYFPVSTKVTIDYNGIVSQVEDTSKIADRYYYYNKVGQFWGVFNSNDSISKQIYMKYLEENSQYYQKLVSINGISVEADYGAVLYVKDSLDDNNYRHIIGETELLELYDDETTIDNFYFKGYNLVEMQDKDRDIPRENEFIDTKITVNEISEIENPVLNGVYTIGGERYIYFKNNWYVFDEKNDVICPVEGIVNYFCEVVKGEY